MLLLAWLLWVSWWVCTCAQHAQHPRGGCSETGGKELDGRSQVKLGHHQGRQHSHHRSKTQRRKGMRVRGEDSAPRIVHHPSDVVVRAGNPATLSCRADGSPRPTLEWLRDGRPLDTSGPLQPLLLPEGSLFFLSVQEGRRGPSHQGVYVCRATNSLGTATSHNASLHVAGLQEEFEVQPSDVEVAEGEVAVLNCTPPSGHPEPNVVWRRNGAPVDTIDHHYTQLSGKLIIAPAEKNHSGSYVCVASNTVGVRQSRAARLSVLAKPLLLLKPGNASVRLGESAQFDCRAKGDPPPTVVWSREHGPLPNGRYLVNPDQTLQIHYVTALDAGKYTCTAVNDVGVTSASAVLQVQDSANSVQKDLHKELSALRVTLENVTIEASGSNMAAVQWKLQSLPAQPHYLDGFEVLHRSLLPSSSDWAAQNVSLPGLQARLGPLQRGYKYEFKVRPYGSGLYGRESNTRHLRVPETVPSACPLAIAITVFHGLNNTVHLSWKPPPHETHNGIIQGYQVWCLDSEEQHQNWTVDSSRHSLDIFTLKDGRRYWLTIAAVNGAGVGVLSDAHSFVINPQIGALPNSEPKRRDTATAIRDVLQDPVLIGSVGAILWCILMVTAVCLFRRHSRTGRLLPGHGRTKGLQRLASQDLIIKHRMAAPDSPWMSGSWRPAFNQKYQDLWAQGQKHPGIRSTSLPVSCKKDSSYLDSAVPIVTDSCGVYGTFYVDLVGSSLKTFNSPGRCPKTPHGPSSLQGAETIQIFPQPASRSSPHSSPEALPWKHAIRPQPRMGVLRESREKNLNKPELHAVNSVPVLSSRNQAGPQSLYQPRLSHVAPAGWHDCRSKGSVCPRLLHYSASLHLLDMLPPPPPPPPQDTLDTYSLSSDEGSSRSTKLTVDLGSLQSVCPASGLHGHPEHTIPSSRCPSYSHLSSTSLPPSLDQHGDTLTAPRTTEYLELSPKPERCSALPQPRPSLSHLLPPSGSFLRGPLRSVLPEDEEESSEEADLPPVGLRHGRLQSTPSSCCSEWEGSLWNTWNSAMDVPLTSARTSLISSVDSCYTNDSSGFARLLVAAAAAADSVSGASLSDFSPPASPLSSLYPSFHPEGDFGDVDAVPSCWDWSAAWMEEMEAQYRALHPARNPRTFNP